MCKHLVSLVYKRRSGSAIRKAVLAYLADRASEDGSGIWCSKGTISNETEVSLGAVKSSIKAFLKEGLLREVGTRRHTNGHTVEYALDVAVLEALDVIRHTTSGATRSNITRSSHDPVNVEPGHTETPTRSSHDPQDGHRVTTNLPKTTLKPNTPCKSPTDILCEVASEGAVRSFLEYRKRQRKPVSETAAKRLAVSLRTIFDSGGDPDDALGMAEERGWQTIRPDWYEREAAKNARSATSECDDIAAEWEREQLDSRQGQGAVVPLLATGHRQGR